MEEKNPRYTVIMHRARLELGLSCNEYCIADTIFVLSNNPDSRVSGWCYMSKETMAKFFGLSKQTVHKIIKRLLAKKIIFKDPDTKYLKCTNKWYGTVLTDKSELKKNNKSLPVVISDTFNASRNTTTEGKESVRNNDIDKEKYTKPWHKKKNTESIQSTRDILNKK